MHVGENGARTWRAEVRIERDALGDLRRHGRKGCRAVGTSEMADIAAHEDEGISGRTRKTGDVTYSVLRGPERQYEGLEGKWKAYAGYVEDVEATVAEQIIRRVLAYLCLGVELDFVHSAASSKHVSCAR